MNEGGDTQEGRGVEGFYLRVEDSPHAVMRVAATKSLARRFAQERTGCGGCAPVCAAASAARLRRLRGCGGCGGCGGCLSCEAVAAAAAGRPPPCTREEGPGQI